MSFPVKPLSQKKLKEKFEQLRIVRDHWETQLKRVMGTFAESQTRKKLQEIENEMKQVGAKIK
jgi:hypothetical protein